MQKFNGGRPPSPLPLPAESMTIYGTQKKICVWYLKVVVRVRRNWGEEDEQERETKENTCEREYVI